MDEGKFKVEGWAYDPKTGKFCMVTSTGGRNVKLGPPVINTEIERIPISAS